MNFVNSRNTHDCPLSENIFGKKLKSHIDCSKVEEEGIMIYTFYWNQHVSCVVQQDGPVYIMDYRFKPFVPKLYLNMESAIGPLTDILSDINA